MSAKKFKPPKTRIKIWEKDGKEVYTIQEYNLFNIIVFLSPVIGQIYLAAVIIDKKYNFFYTPLSLDEYFEESSWFGEDTYSSLRKAKHVLDGYHLRKEELFYKKLQNKKSKKVKPKYLTYP